MDSKISSENIKIILATDCGSTTTKSILIQYTDGAYRLTHRGEAPTTVEAPFEDVTRGVLNAIMELEELSGHNILDGERKSFHPPLEIMALIFIFPPVQQEGGYR